MTIPIPAQPKIYHIVHLDKLASILATGALLSDVKIHQMNIGGSVIGMQHIKERRMSTRLSSFSDLTVGGCVPFYFCPRSVMLYIISQRSHADLGYTDGQEPIIHLQSDLMQTVAWANANHKRWAFTDSNAGSFYFNDYNNLSLLSQIDWNAVSAAYWMECREKKQAEFLIEEQFPWQLVESIGVYSNAQAIQVNQILNNASHRPPVQTKREWYY